MRSRDDPPLREFVIGVASIVGGPGRLARSQTRTSQRPQPGVWLPHVVGLAEVLRTANSLFERALTPVAAGWVLATDVENGHHSSKSRGAAGTAVVPALISASRATTTGVTSPLARPILTVNGRSVR